MTVVIPCQSDAYFLAHSLSYLYVFCSVNSGSDWKKVRKIWITSTDSGVDITDSKQCSLEFSFLSCDLQVQSIIII